MDLSRLDGSLSDAARSERWPADGPSPLQGAWLRDASRVAPDADSGQDERMARLLRTIEAEIIPRLMLAHHVGRPFATAEATESIVPSADDVAEFARVVLGADAAESAGYVEARRTEGMALQTIYMDLLAPAARRLGALWESDQCDFTQVTLGLWRIQQVMYDLSPAFQRAAPVPGRARHALLAAAPASQHTLGLFMVSEFFRRAGWQVWSEAGATVEQVVAVVGAEWFDVVGFSIGTEQQFDALAPMVQRVREASRNPEVCVLAGGPLISADPARATLAGADAAAADAAHAVAQAEQWVIDRARARLRKV